jgi:hypothetical protein
MANVEEIEGVGELPCREVSAAGLSSTEALLGEGAQRHEPDREHGRGQVSH